MGVSKSANLVHILRVYHAIGLLIDKIA